LVVGEVPEAVLDLGALHYLGDMILAQANTRGFWRSASLPSAASSRP